MTEEKEIPLPEDRMVKFENLAFGMFIHWGLYSQLGRGEWAQHILGYKPNEYMKLKESFRADNFDAAAYVKLARQVGMKYICLTTRHHDGFSLYDTRGLNDYDAVHSPAGRDLVQEFVGACRDGGLLPFFYHTTMDWFWRGKKTWDLSAEEFNDYLDYLYASIENLCTHYGEIGGFWFDGNWCRPEMDWKLDRLYGMIRRLQPNAIITDNTGIQRPGEIGHPEIDNVTFENQVASPLDRRGHKKYIAGEMCQTMNSHWGAGSNDINYKSVPELIRFLAKSRKVGANYLLNVGLSAQGAIPEMEASTLRAVGRWTHRFADAIYETKPCSVRCEGEDFILEREGRYYWFVHDLGITGHGDVTVNRAGELKRTASGLEGEVKSVQWVDNDEPLQFSQAGNKLSVEMTGYPYGTDWVVRVADIKVSR